MSGRQSIRCTAFPGTSNHAGAIGVVQLSGDVESALTALTGVARWPSGLLRLVDFAEIDRGLAFRLRSDNAVLMPHGGPRVRQRLLSHLRTLGVSIVNTAPGDPLAAFPEAADEIEAMALETAARLTSPLGLDLLLDQPRRWRDDPETPLNDDERARSVRLDRLITPPLVVLAGAANVGKSTLSNRLVGRSMSITADLPGTTRDYTAARINLGGLVVDWVDTPGLHDAAEPSEARAIELARILMERCELLIAMTDHEAPWPTLPRQPDLRIANKADLGGRDKAALSLSAATGQGVAQLVERVRIRLLDPADLNHAGRWAFHERLRQRCRNA